jgi:hypothetical protein
MEGRHTFIRFRARFLSVLLFSLPGVVSCGTAEPPCAASNCPNVSGTFLLTFGAGGLSASGCPADALLPQGGPLVLAQVNAAVTGSFNGVALNGTLYANDELRLRSQSTTGVALYVLDGPYSPLPDGGPGRYSGTFTASGLPIGDAGTLTGCVASGGFTALAH